MRLYDLVDKRDQGIKIFGLTDSNNAPVTIVYGHIDGMYSYCWLEGQPKKVVHLSANMPIKKVKGGYAVDE